MLCLSSHYRRHFFSAMRISVATLFAAVSVMIAATQVVHAGIITRDLNVTLNAETLEDYNLDLDLDGTDDFIFTASAVRNEPIDDTIIVGFDTVDVPFASSNGVVVDENTFDGFPTASLLLAGDMVSGADLFSFGSSDQSNLFFYVFGDASGHFEGQTGFIGLKFEGVGGVYFGFAQLTVNSLDAAVNPLGLTIGTVGYNDTLGQAVQIPQAVSEPVSLALFSLGLLCVASVRRKIISE